MGIIHSYKVAGYSNYIRINQTPPMLSRNCKKDVASVLHYSSLPLPLPPEDPPPK